MNDEALTFLGVIAICLLIAVHAALRVRASQFMLVDPLNMFWGGVIVCYVIQPIAFFGQFQEMQPTASIPAVLAWIWIGLATVIVGYESSFGPAIGRRFPSAPMNLSKTRLGIFGLLLIFVGLLGYSYEVSTAGGLLAWLAEPRGGTDWEVASSYAATVSMLLPVGAALLLFSVEIGRRHTLITSVAWLVALVMLCWFIYLGTRSRTILWVVTMLSAYYLPRKRDPPILLVMLLFPVMLVGANFLGNNRESFTNLSMNLTAEEAVDRLKLSAQDSMGFGEGGYRTTVEAGTEFNYVISAIELVPSDVPYTYGYNFLEFVTRPIPRAIWENKRYPAAEAFTPLLDAGGLSSTWVPTSVEPILMGPAPTFVGFWWAVGGPIGLLLGGFFTGVMLRAISAIYDRSGGNNQGDLIIYWALLGIGFVEAAATPLSWVFGLPLTFLPLVVVLKLASSPTRRTTRGPTNA